MLPIKHNQQYPQIVLYQPDIPGNTGTILRLGACLGLRVHVIEPAGFRLDDTSMKRAGMDYLELASLKRHDDWAAFQDWRTKENKRLILLTTKTLNTYTDFAYTPNDCLLFGRESSGVPEDVVTAADKSLTIPMRENARSINVAMSVAMVTGEAVRQLAKR